MFLFTRSSSHAQRFWPDFHRVELAGSSFYRLVCCDKPGSLDFGCLSLYMCQMRKNVCSLNSYSFHEGRRQSFRGEYKGLHRSREVLVYQSVLFSSNYYMSAYTSPSPC